MTNITNIIRNPVITEKSAQLQEKKIYTFWVSPKATKIDIKIAIKSLYGVDVKEVKMVKVPNKFRAIRKGVMNKRKEFSKAYITLNKGAELDFTKVEKADKKEVKVKASTEKSKVAKASTSKKSTAKKKVTTKK